MSDPTRFLREGSDLGRAVLGSVDDEPMPPELRRKIHAAVVASVASVATGSASAGVTAGIGTASKATVATAATKTSSVLASVGMAKWVGVIVVGAVVSVGARTVTRSLTSRADPVSKPAAAPLAETHLHSAAPPGPLAVTGTRDIPPVVPETLNVPVVSAAPVAPPGAASNAAPVSASRPPATDVGGDLPAELVLIESARAALDENDLGLSLDRLNRYDLVYPHGVLKPEALGLRIRAYAGKHDGDRVKQLANQFRAEYPNHPFAAHLDAIVAGANP